MNDAGSSNQVPYDKLEAWEGGSRGKGHKFLGSWNTCVHVYLWLVHVDIWQTPTQYCKASITVKNKLKKKDTVILG